MSFRIELTPASQETLEFIVDKEGTTYQIFDHDAKHVIGYYIEDARHPGIFQVWNRTRRIPIGIIDRNDKTGTLTCRRSSESLRQIFWRDNLLDPGMPQNLYWWNALSWANETLYDEEGAVLATYLGGGVAAAAALIAMSFSFKLYPQFHQFYFDFFLGLPRFLHAQNRYYSKALAEISAGTKNSHWVWFIFPQIKGLGRRPISQYYAIRDMDEAKEYLAHSVLCVRLEKASSELLRLDGNMFRKNFGLLDVAKIHASMTLFWLVDQRPLFLEVLEKFWEGELHAETVRLLTEKDDTEFRICTNLR